MNNTVTLSASEKHLSQIPALQLLINLGYEYLTPKQALAERGGKRSNVLLEGILHTQLQRLNQIQHKGKDYLFSEANIQEAIQKLKNVKYDGWVKTNQEVYDLLTLGTALEQSIEGDYRSFTLRYIDWHDWRNNVFHVVAEYPVERTRSLETVKPDIVLFVNGIPLAVMECKAPDIALNEGISQMLRNQTDEYIPKLFSYIQLVLVSNKNTVQYATTGTSEEYWGNWQELHDQENNVATRVNQMLSDAQKQLLFTGDFAADRSYFDTLEQQGERLITEQDKAIYSLCRPERLLELSYLYIVFDNSIKKIARYQQFFVIKSILQRIKRQAQTGKRAGGMVWHTQGSGKSLTMVMLARALSLDQAIKNARILLVTDRDDLDVQLGNTFTACGLSQERANSGRDLVDHLKAKVGIITTLIHKFEKGWGAKKYVDDSSDIFVLVDESHRTNFGSLAARMQQMLPNACYLGFTGTPLLKKDKNSFAKFGELIEPHYSMQQAVQDKAVVPLLYEARHVEMVQNQAAIDIWFDRHTAELTKEQKADLKRKYARAETLNQVDQVIYMRAFDISEHYQTYFKGTPFKAQLVAPRKAVALKYHEYLSELGMVSSAVLISAPDMREGYDSVDSEPDDVVVKFWKKMMAQYGSEQEYNKSIISQFKHGEQPEIIIVVDKLLTGFDAPKNTVLYLCRNLREHILLQAIARVNRLYPGKEFGYIIDYVGELGELDKALTMYDAFTGFDEVDIAGTLISIQVEIAQLPQKHADMWDIFKTLKNQHDPEAYEHLLGDIALREEFYERFRQFKKILAIALSSTKFLREIDEIKLNQYKNDLRYFERLRISVKRRYFESIDYDDYGPKIKKLLDTHIQANEVIQLNQPVNIFDQSRQFSIKEEPASYSAQSTGSRADTIAHMTKKHIAEKMAEDPAFYEKFSKLIQQAIDDFRANRLADVDYLARVNVLHEKVLQKKHDDTPIVIQNNDDACAYYGIIKPLLSDYAQAEAMAVEIALAIQAKLIHYGKVDFWYDDDAQKAAQNAIDDFLYDDLSKKFGIKLSIKTIDGILAKTLQVARSRVN